jgi:hypothetical protein
MASQMVRNEPRHSWTIASSVAVIIFGSYLVHNSRNSNPATIIIKPAAERTPGPMTPGPFPLKR